MTQFLKILLRESRYCKRDPWKGIRHRQRQGHFEGIRIPKAYDCDNKKSEQIFVINYSNYFWKFESN